jgi:putative flippase GtrA
MDNIVKTLLARLSTKRRVLKFLVIGGSLYLLSVFLLFVFREKMGFDETLANIYQTGITYVLQFVLNAVITWADRTASAFENLRRIARYIPIKIVLWFVNQVIFAFWLFFGLHYQIANALTVLTILVVNYFAFDRLIFIKERTLSKPEKSELISLG